MSSSFAVAPAEQVSSKRLVRRKREASVVLVALALFALAALLALAGTFPLVVRSATAAVAASRVGQGRRSSTSLFEARREFPFSVVVENGERGFRGAGTLVDDRFVLTAAHNVLALDVLGRVADTMTSPAQMEVSIREKWSVPLQKRRVTRVWVHKAFSSGVGSAKSVNLAVLQLESPFEKRARGAPDYWESARLATEEEGELAEHGTVSEAPAFGRVAATSEIVRVEAGEFVGPAESEIVRCGDPQEWLQNNNSLCFAPRTALPPHVCSGDTGGPLMVRDKKGVAVVVGVVSSAPRGCLGEQAPHQWGFAVSVSKTRAWIDAVVRDQPFAATEASIGSPSLIDHDAWRDGDVDGEVFCSADGGTFRVLGLGKDPSADWKVRHCGTGREVNMAVTKLKQCSKPCALKVVRTTEDTLENISERNYAVMCSKTEAFRATGRTAGFQVSNSVRREVQSCKGGVPKWMPASELQPCPESACLETPPVDFEHKLPFVCDRLGNAALLTGTEAGWMKEKSVIVPVYFQDKVQVVPCHGGPAQWLYRYSTQTCTVMEINRCRGPEGTRRIMNNHPVALLSSENGIAPVTDAELGAIDQLDI